MAEPERLAPTPRAEHSTLPNRCRWRHIPARRRRSGRDFLEGFPGHPGRTADWQKSVTRDGTSRRRL